MSHAARNTRSVRIFFGIITRITRGHDRRFPRNVGTPVTRLTRMSHIPAASRREAGVWFQTIKPFNDGTVCAIRAIADTVERAIRGRERRADCLTRAYDYRFPSRSLCRKNYGRDPKGCPVNSTQASAYFMLRFAFAPSAIICIRTNWQMELHNSY